MTQETTLRILTIDGEEHEFAMSVQSDNASYTIGSRLEKLLNQRNIALAIEDRLLVIPMTQVRSIEIFPISNKLPETVVPAVRVIQSSLVRTMSTIVQKPTRQKATVHAPAELVSAGR